jgi:hypothetical protein
MIQLMQPGDAMRTRDTIDRSMVTQRRNSSVPHISNEEFTMRKRGHFTKLHGKTPVRAQSARLLRNSPGSSRGSTPRADPTTRAHQEIEGSSKHEAWPEGRPDPKQVGKYRSQTNFAIDKRRHAANVDGNAAADRARSRDAKQHAADGSAAYDEEGFINKPDFCARGDKYRSQYALAQHKQRHLAQLHSEPNGVFVSAATPRSPGPDGTINKDLFTSQKDLDYGKRGHVVSLNSVRSLARTRSEDLGSDYSSSCDVGKGISRMMHNHRDDEIHTSQAQFHLKKKNHATSVHRAPKGPLSDGASAVSEPNSNCGADILKENRRSSIPHHSCKAFSLKKKYHQTNVHATTDSRLHPESLKQRPEMTDPDEVISHKQMNQMKKIHAFEYNPGPRKKREDKPLPVAPVPRNGQWTPQHICD